MFLLPSKFKENWLKHVWVIAIFLKCAKRRTEKYEETKTNFEGAYLHDGLADSAEIWNGMCPTPRDFPQKKIVQFCSGITELQMRENGIYLVPV